MKTASEKNHAYYLKNREKILSRRKLYYLNNRLAIKEYRKLDNITNNTYKKSNLKKLGLTLEEYNKLLLIQNNVCTICSKPCKTGRQLAVDHSHDNNAIRGLLCGRCNMAIGLLDDNISLLNSAITYLKRGRITL